jgi:hypothetical protein
VAAEVYFSKRCAPITGSRAKCLSNGTNFMWPNSLQEFRSLIKVCFLFKSKIEINALTNLQADITLGRFWGFLPPTPPVETA